MKQIQDVYQKNNLPIKVVQFGEGRLLRTLIEPAFQKAIDEKRLEGSIAIVKPTGRGNLNTFQQQDCLYTIVQRGKQDGNTSDEAIPIT